MPLWPAAQLPGLYPKDTLKKQLDYIKSECLRARSILNSCAELNMDMEQQEQLLRKNHFSVDDRKDGKIVLFFASDIAPELDTWIILD